MELRDYETAFTALDEVIGRFRTTKDTYLKGLVVEAFMNRAFMRGALDDFKGEIESYDELIGVVGDIREGDTEAAGCAAGVGLQEHESGRDRPDRRGRQDMRGT